MCTYIHIYMFIFWWGGVFYFHVRTVKVRCSLNCSWISVDSVGLNSSWRFMETKFPTVQRQFNEWIWNATSKPQPIRILSSSRAGPSDTAGPDTTVDHGGLSWLDQDCDDDYTPHLSWGCGFVSAGPCIMEQRLQTQQQQQSGLLMSPWYKYNIEDLVCCQTRPHTEGKPPHHSTKTQGLCLPGFSKFFEQTWSVLVPPSSEPALHLSLRAARLLAETQYGSLRYKKRRRNRFRFEVFLNTWWWLIWTHTHTCVGFLVVLQ